MYLPVQFMFVILLRYQYCYSFLTFEDEKKECTLILQNMVVCPQNPKRIEYNDEKSCVVYGIK